MATARINSTSDGDNTVVTAVANKRVEVWGIFASANAAGVITIQDSAASPVIFMTTELTDGGGFVLPIGSKPWFTTNIGAGLEVSNAAGVDTLGLVVYELKGRD